MDVNGEIARKAGDSPEIAPLNLGIPIFPHPHLPIIKAAIAFAAIAGVSAAAPSKLEMSRVVVSPSAQYGELLALRGGAAPAAPKKDAAKPKPKAAPKPAAKPVAKPAPKKDAKKDDKKKK